MPAKKMILLKEEKVLWKFVFVWDERERKQVQREYWDERDKRLAVVDAVWFFTLINHVSNF